MVKWVFLDVGNVLFNDDPQGFWIFRRFHEALAAIRPGYSFADMLAEREARVASGSPMILLDLARDLLGKDQVAELFQRIGRELIPRYDEVHLPVEDLIPTLTELRRDYSLGIIANQPTECRASLERRGLLPFFDVIAISDELSLQKPQLEIFRWALEQAGAAASQCVMVGDRRDNDILPAARIGMRTVWLDWPGFEAKNWRPEAPEARAYLASLDRLPLFHSGANAKIRADRSVQSFGALRAAIDQLG